MLGQTSVWGAYRFLIVRASIDASALWHTLDMRFWILIGGLFTLSLFLQIVGHIKSTVCVWHLRNNCADFGFAESAFGIVIGILAVVLLTVKLLMRLKNTSAP